MKIRISRSCSRTSLPDRLFRSHPMERHSHDRIKLSPPPHDGRILRGHLSRHSLRADFRHYLDGSPLCRWTWDYLERPCNLAALEATQDYLQKTEAPQTVVSLSPHHSVRGFFLPQKI